MNTPTNQPLVKSVCRGLHEGFWPWADTHIGTYPDTHDKSLGTPHDPVEAAFLCFQRDHEIKMECFSPSFGHNLLPGTYSSLIHGVFKPHTTKLWLVMNQSAGLFAPNSMIPWDCIMGYPLDNMTHLGEMLLHMQNKEGNFPLMLFKSDIAEAYRLLPVYPYWQIKQINTIDGERLVDCNNCFSGHGSGVIFITFDSLVTWIAKNVKFIPYLGAYSDDCFGINQSKNLISYKKYNKLMPEQQVKLLCLWDELSIPHEERKQTWGVPLTIIGININPNKMTLLLPPNQRTDLIAELRKFCLTTPRHRGAYFSL